MELFDFVHFHDFPRFTNLNLIQGFLKSWFFKNEIQIRTILIFGVFCLIVNICILQQFGCVLFLCNRCTWVTHKSHWEGCA